MRGVVEDGADSGGVSVSVVVGAVGVASVSVVAVCDVVFCCCSTCAGTGGADSERLKLLNERLRLRATSHIPVVSCAVSTASDICSNFRKWFQFDCDEKQRSTIKNNSDGQ